MMAKEPKVECSCVIDTAGLHAVATASGNLKATLMARIKDGTIGVPSWAFQELRAAYEDDAKQLSPHIAKRFPLNVHVEVGAARITERLNLGFSRGAFDTHVERHTAALASIKSLTVITSPDNVSSYDGMGC